MEKNLEKNEQIVNQEITDVIDVIETEEIKDVVFRHPQQLLTTKEIQNLFRKKSKVDEENVEREKRGEELVEGLTEIEKGAINLFLLRAKHHNSKPKQLTSKERTARKAKRKAAKQSRKINR